MKSLWNDDEAGLYQGELGQRVYSSRLLGREPMLVLHGGGNTSVKLSETNLVGEEEPLLYVCTPSCRTGSWTTRTPTRYSPS
jgi:rhamnose utilization protein RhaD (predicted bifunctional aldolase and dehydrogenase)